MPKVTWNQDEVEDRKSDGDFSPLPRGRYLTEVSDIEEKKTKDRKGKLWVAELTVIDGSFTNRKLWVNFNVENPSEQAQDIGRAQLKQLFTACDRAGETDSDKLIGRECVAIVSIERSEGYDDKNRVNGFAPPDTYDSSKTPARERSPAPAPREERAPARGSSSRGAAPAGRRGAAPARSSGAAGGKAAAGGKDFDDDIPF